MTGTEAVTDRQTDSCAGRTEPYLVMDKPMVEDAVHVSAEPFQAAILGPDIWVADGHQTFHCGLQVAKELPVLLPEEEHSEIHQRYSKKSFATGTLS